MRILLTVWLLLAACAGHAFERVTYYHNDALGSPVAATDRNGTLLWRESYAPYGERLTREASGKDTVWYTGKPEEAAFGLSYFGARWYDPKIGRFMGVDAAGFSADNIHTFNRYAYSNNNPYKYVDPNGNSPLDIGFFIADSIKLAIAINSGNPAAIQSAAIDFVASAIGVASPVPGTGEYIKGARAGIKVAKLAEKANEAKNVPQKLYHYTGASPQKIAAEGLKPGSSGKVFTTPKGDLSPLQAQIDLALPPNRGLPNHLLEIDVPTLQSMGISAPKGTQVGRGFNMPGGGTENVFTHAIPSEAIKVVR